MTRLYFGHSRKWWTLRNVFYFKKNVRGLDSEEELSSRVEKSLGKEGDTAFLQYNTYQWLWTTQGPLTLHETWGCIRGRRHICLLVLSGEIVFFSGIWVRYKVKCIRGCFISVTLKGFLPPKKKSHESEYGWHSGCSDAIHETRLRWVIIHV